MCRRRCELVSPRSLAVLLILGMVTAFTPTAVARTSCSFTLGFKALHDLMPDVVGDCLENAQADAATGNLTQRTVNGLLMWRKADNWTAFSDGPTTYVAGPDGIAARPTDGPKLPWEPQRPPPPPPAARRGAQSAASARVPEGVLFQDDFNDPGISTCSALAGHSHPDLKFECTDGELRILGVGPPDTSLQITLPGRYGNASVTTDARLVSGSEQRAFILHCREDVQRDTGYALVVTPALQTFVMGRSDPTGWKTLVGPATSDAIKPGGETNRLELSCVGEMVTGRANGVDLGAFQDGTHRAGQFRVSAHNASNVPLPIDARFDNLIVAER